MTVLILYLLYSFLSFLPFVNTTIDPIESTPWIFDISNDSILFGILSRFNICFNSSNAPILFSYFLLFISENFSRYSIAFFLTISIKLFFSPFWGTLIVTFWPFLDDSHSDNIKLSSISSSIIISLGTYSCSI